MSVSDDTNAETTDASAEASQAPAPVADDVLLKAVSAARAALREITPAATIGEPAGHLVEGERVLSLLFENTLPGYPGWYWTVTLSREDGTDEVNVLETELMPGDGALLAPDWVPWADRLAEYQAQKKAEREAAEAAGEPEPEDDFVSDDDELDEEEDEDAFDDDDDLDDDDGLDVDDLEVDDFADESAELQGVEEAALSADEEE